MPNSYIYLLVSILIQTGSSFEVISDYQDENKFDGARQISSLPYYSSILADGSFNNQQENGPECLAKNLFFNMLTRHRRASISRPYFHHWRGSRDNSRYSSKNLLAFSPRLGKRAGEIENDFDVPTDKRQIEDDHGSPDLDTFLAILAGQLQRKKIDIVYEDATKICLSEAVTDAFIKDVIDKFDTNRRQQEEAARERHFNGKHPLLFRYRLG